MNAEPIRHSAKPGSRPPGSRPMTAPGSITVGLTTIVLSVCAPFWLLIGYAIWWLA